MISVTELALTESRSLRSQYADQVAVLDKVKEVRLLPDDLHVSIEMVAAYYEVTVEAIQKLVQRNRDELTDNGMSVLAGQALKDCVAATPLLPISTPRLTVFDRRTLLNAGQLLRESATALAVRHLLVDGGDAA